MKKILSMLLVFSLLLGCSTAMAEDLGVQIIGDPNANSGTEPLSFDDIKVGKDYRIDSYSVITPISFEFVDIFAQWKDGMPSTKKGSTYRDRNVVYCENPSDGEYHKYVTECGWKESGTEAEFAWLKIDILNIKKVDVNFMGDITVKVVYDDEYEYGGWVRQFDFDLNNTTLYRYDFQTTIGMPVCMGSADEKPIGVMYTGHYVCGCTLPNFVVNDKKSSLKMVIDIGGNELTYIIRK